MLLLHRYCCLSVQKHMIHVRTCTTNMKHALSPPPGQGRREPHNLLWKKEGENVFFCFKNKRHQVKLSSIYLLLPIETTLNHLKRIVCVFIYEMNTKLKRHTDLWAWTGFIHGRTGKAKEGGRSKYFPWGLVLF